MEKPFKNTEKNDETVEKMSEGTPRPKKKMQKKNAKLILRPIEMRCNAMQCNEMHVCMQCDVM